MALESQFQAKLIKDIKKMFPECIVIKTDPEYLQGFPDLLILFREKWAALEVKATNESLFRPNQSYYINIMNRMSFAAFINPENKEEILNALQQSFRPVW